MLNSYVALDLETSGLDPKIDRIIEVGAVKVIDGRVEDRLSSLVDPGMKLNSSVMEITGITDQMLMGQPEMKELLPKIKDFVGDLPLLGHQIMFDYRFLKRAMVNNGIKFEKNGIDTLMLSRKFLPAENKKNLKEACAWFGIEFDAHRAFSDAMATHELYQALKKRFGNENPKLFEEKQLIYKIKREQPANKRQKEHLRDLLKYHRIDTTVKIDCLTRNEISRMIDKIILKHGKICK